MTASKNSQARQSAERRRDIVPAATTSLSPRGGAKHRTMKESILKYLKRAGARGLTIQKLSEKLEVLKPRVQGWFSGTGKHTPEIEKIGVGRWKYIG